MKIAVFDSTGMILRIVRVPVGHASMQCREGEDWMEVGDVVSDDTHYVSDFKIVAMPPKPTEYHRWDNSTKEWVVNPDEAWAKIRRKRDALITATDWTQLPDVPTTLRSKYHPYRQALRDITDQPDPLNIDWPTPP